LLHSSRAPRSLPSFPTRRSSDLHVASSVLAARPRHHPRRRVVVARGVHAHAEDLAGRGSLGRHGAHGTATLPTRSSIFMNISRRSEEHTSELQSRGHLVCRLLLE